MSETIKGQTAQENAARRKQRFQDEPEFRAHILSVSNKKPANFLRDFRINKLQLTQQQLADLMELSKSTIRNWDNDRHFPDEENRKVLDRLATDKGIAPINWKQYLGEP